MMAGSLGCAVSNHIWVYTAFAFVVGFGNAGVNCNIITLLSELVGPKYKNMISGSGMSIGENLPFIVLSLQAWLIPNWRQLLYIISAPYLLLILGCYL